MDQGLKPEDIAGAFAWWREAGLDWSLEDEPHGWLRAPEPVAAEATVAPERRIEAPPPPVKNHAIPVDYAAFIDWWMNDPTLDSGAVGARVGPRGAIGAEIMALVSHPEAEDVETLLSGPQGRLFSAMLAAMGFAPDRAYVASVLPRHMPHPDWAALTGAGFAQIAARHIGLAAPKRLIVFGNNILPLLGHDPANNPAPSRQFNHEGGSIPLLAARDLAAMLERPKWKADFWRDWLEWSRTALGGAAKGTETT